MESSVHSPRLLLEVLSKNIMNRILDKRQNQVKIHILGVSSTGCLRIHGHFQSYKTDVDWLGKLLMEFQQSPLMGIAGRDVLQNQAKNRIAPFESEVQLIKWWCVQMQGLVPNSSVLQCWMQKIQEPDHILKHKEETDEHAEFCSMHSCTLIVQMSIYVINFVLFNVFFCTKYFNICLSLLKRNKVPQSFIVGRV